jgi:hypothetical protein
MGNQDIAQGSPLDSAIQDQRCLDFKTNPIHYMCVCIYRYMQIYMYIIYVYVHIYTVLGLFNFC